MKTNRLDIGGGITFWTLSDQTDFEKLSAGLRAAGFGKFAPEPRTAHSVLKETLEKLHPGGKVFQTRNKEEFEVVRVSQQTGRNEYQHRLTARYEFGRIVTDDSTQDEITNATFADLRNRLPYHAITRILTEIVNAIGGTTLRPTGGIYWVRFENLERWELAAHAIESASLDGKSKVHVVRAVFDSGMVAAVAEGLTREIQTNAAEIDAALHDPAAGWKARGTQRAHAERLRQKVATYERDLGIALDGLRAELDRATDRVVIATLTESAAAAAEATGNQSPQLAFASP